MASPFDLGAEQWHRRVLLLFAPTAQSEALGEQRRLLAGQAEPMASRDLIVVEVIENAPTLDLPADVTLSLRQRFHVKPGQFRVVLVGKDGAAKLREESPVAPPKLFGKIDSMPMRRREMQSRPQ